MRFEAGLFEGIDLEETVQFLLVAPGAAVVVEQQFAGREVTDDRIQPAGQLDRQALGRAIKQLDNALDGGRQS
jgi:hypothetical protein